MKVLFILDPLASLKIQKDTSLAMMRIAQARSHQLSVAGITDLALHDGRLEIRASPFRFITKDGATEHFSVGAAQPFLATEFDAIIMRKDPPFDMEFLYATHLLDCAQMQGTRVFNRPSSLRDWNEKLSITRFAQFAPAFLVSSQSKAIREFLTEHHDIVVKPLDGMGGSKIFRITQSDPNINVILETMTAFDTNTIMAQRFVPEISLGDKRILIIDGEPLDYALARIPKAGETRGNLAAGGRGVAQKLSTRDREIATAIGPTLREAGLFLVGLDVIGDYLTEVNVTSPTGMVEIAAQTDCDPALITIKALERACLMDVLNKTSV